VVSLTVSTQGVEISAARIAIDRLLRARWRSRIALAVVDGFTNVSPEMRELRSRFVRIRSPHNRTRIARRRPGSSESIGAKSR